MINSQLILTTLATLANNEESIDIDALKVKYNVTEDDEIQARAAMKNEVVRQRMAVTVGSIIDCVKTSGVNLGELYAGTVKWSPKSADHKTTSADELKGAYSSSKGWQSACHENCHTNCHGSRGWR